MALTAAGVVGLERLDRAFPPPLDAITVSTEVVDRDGNLLRAFASPEGRWRMAVDLKQVDGKFTDMLVAYEDKRFWTHHGVDLQAVARAAWQLATSGRIVSGGSTITMQLARLMEPRSERSLVAKLRQAARALQIERRLSKEDILERYLTLAPYGGNVEGVRAAALTWFGKEPKRLTMGEAALLVSLPQAPEARRPDRNRKVALAARDRVLARMVESDRLQEREMARAIAEPIRAMRTAMPSLAAHAADEALRREPSATKIELTLRRSAQEGLEAVAREAAQRLGRSVNVAMVMADATTGEVIARVGSADFFDPTRAGWIDMTRISRSPGSTLKPFIYGLAMEQGLVAQETIIEDRPSDFSGYRPKNFDMSYQGDVSIRTALQMSLNVPAISLLDAIGPTRLTARFRQAGVKLMLPAGEKPGLAIGLGGAGITLTDLVQLYAGLANQGRSVVLHEGGGEAMQDTNGILLEPTSAWQVSDILSGVAPPANAPRNGLAYKTGTSYGYRDAWSVGFDGRHVLGVWVGRPDGAAVPGLSGYETAAPILFDAFARSGVAMMPRPPAPPGAVRLSRERLPVTLRKFKAAFERQTAALEAAPRIIFPPNGARIALDGAGAEMSPLVLKLQGGRAPFRWLANGRPLPDLSRKRTNSWLPEGGGFSRLTVIDAAGRAASVEVFLE
jgi:penicillin-binding protein 1C